MAQIATTGACCGRVGDQAIKKRVVLEAVFSDVGDEHRGLRGDEEKLRQQGPLFLAEVDGAHRLCFIKRGLALLQNRHQFDRFLVSRTRGFGHAVQRFFDRRQVGQAQLGLNGFDVGDRIDLASHMNNVVVFKAAHHVDGRVGFTDVREKFVA